MSAKEFTSYVMEQYPGGIYILDHERRYVYANATYMDMLGLSYAELMMHEVHELMSNGNYDICISDIVFAQRHAVSVFSNVYANVGGVLKRKRHLVRAIPVFDEAGEIVYMLAFCDAVDYLNGCYYEANSRKMADLENTFYRRDEKQHDEQLHFVYGDNVFEKDGIRRDKTGDGEKTRCLCGKRGIFNRDGPAMGPQIIRQLERRASRRSASFFHALASPGRPRNGGGAAGAYSPAEGRKTLIQGHFRAQKGPLGPSRKSQQQTKRTGFAALEDSIADEAPEGKRAKRANRALNRAEINDRAQKHGGAGTDRRGRSVTSR